MSKESFPGVPLSREQLLEVLEELNAELEQRISLGSEDVLIQGASLEQSLKARIGHSNGNGLFRDVVFYAVIALSLEETG